MKTRWCPRISLKHLGIAVGHQVFQQGDWVTDGSFGIQFSRPFVLGSVVSPHDGIPHRATFIGPICLAWPMWAETSKKGET